MKIFVFSPDYTHQSGGIEAMHYLMYLLQRCGHKVITNTAVYNPAFDLKPEFRLLPERTDDMIIAPEIINLEGFYNLAIPVLRWVLYFPGRHGGPAVFPEEETVYHYRKVFKKEAKQASYYKRTKELFLPHLSKEDFKIKQKTLRDKGGLYFVHKGKNLKAHPESAVEINRENTVTREMYLNLLRRYKTLYCYDPDTYLLAESFLSGMKVMVWDYKGNKWKRILFCREKFRNYARDAKNVQKILKDFSRKNKMKTTGNL
ncbi:MAG: hypothetical protein JXR81_11495 [Candidatus Goldbacteria bacterium]|nr:hypothetical protein [Candidatus Goldiibacteriota bacterium]